MTSSIAICRMSMTRLLCFTLWDCGYSARVASLFVRDLGPQSGFSVVDVAPLEDGNAWTPLGTRLITPYEC